MRFGVVSDLTPPFRGFRLKPLDTAFVSLAVSHFVESSVQDGGQPSVRAWLITCRDVQPNVGGSPGLDRR